MIGRFTAAALGLALLLGSAPMPASADDATDAAITTALSALAVHRDCEAHRALRTLAARYPRGEYPADALFLQRRYDDAFAAYLPLVDQQHMTEGQRQALISLIVDASRGVYPTVLHAALANAGSNELAALVVGEIAFVKGQPDHARSLWLSGAGSRVAPEGSSYTGETTSMLVMLDRLLLQQSCRPARPTPPAKRGTR